jgi:hypothetical protein
MWSTLAGWLLHAHPAQTSPKNFKHPKLLIYKSKNYEICTPAKLIVKHIFTKSFKKSKNKMRSSDTAQNQFGHSRFDPLGINTYSNVTIQ